MAAGFTADGQPSRPYSSPEQVPAGAEFRSREFATGTTGDPGSAASSLNEDSARYNLLTPKQFTPTSVLQPITKNPGGNGMSAADASRRLADGTPLGSVNGTSASSFEPAAMLRLAGQQDAI
jgi:hypothetical protein